MRIAVGCPILRREWIIDRWCDHVRVAAAAVDAEVELIFVGGEDDPTWDVIADHAPGPVTRVLVPEDRPADVRVWNWDRYRRMVELRNRLLGTVRLSAPSVFVSVDSDILLAPEQLVNLTESLERFDAVGGACYLGPPSPNRVAGSLDRSLPSVAALTRHGTLMRADQPGAVMAAEIIMAIKAMSPAAYWVDYVFHPQGEDIGWSLEARRHGLRLGWDSRVYAKHVMGDGTGEAPLLSEVDPRVGF